jgi:hypothetical protein
MDGQVLGVSIVSFSVILNMKSTALQQINGNIALIVIDTDSCGISIDGIYKSNYHISYDLENPDISECAVV